MNEREQFEAEFPLAIWDADICGYSDLMYTYALVGWKKCAESKQSELDKANARIAQLEESLNNIDSLRDNIISTQSIGWSKHIYPLVEILDEAIAKQPSTWRSEHDNAVEVRVLEEAKNICLPCCSGGLYRMIESRKLTTGTTL